MTFPKLSQVVLVPKLDQTVRVLHRWPHVGESVRQSHTDTEGEILCIGIRSEFWIQCTCFFPECKTIKIIPVLSMIVALEKGGRCVTLSSYILTCGSLQLWPLWPAAAADVTWNHCSKLNPVTQLHFWHVRPEPKKSLCHVLPAAACCRFQKEKKSHVDQLMDPVEPSTLLPLISLHHLHGGGKKEKPIVRLKIP